MASSEQTLANPPKVAKPTLGGDQIKRVIELLLLADSFQAEAVLREVNAARRHGLNHRHGTQIQRIEGYFREHSGRPPWPTDFQPGQLIHFREVLGGLLECAPLKTYLEDLKATCHERNSLLYYLSTEQGKRASRWEMLALDHKLAQHEAQKQKFALEAKEAYLKLFGTQVPGKQAWVVKLEDELKQVEHLLPLTQDESKKREMRERAEFIRQRIAKFQTG